MKNMTVCAIDQPTADGFMAQHHYLGNAPIGSSWRFGLYEQEKGGFRLTGVAVLSAASRPSIPQSVLPGAEGEVLELRRFATDSRVANAGSFFVSQVLRLLPPTIAAVVSYADPSKGHHGGLYQACGATYLGTSSAKAGETPKERYIFLLGQRRVTQPPPPSRPYPKPDLLPAIPPRSEFELRSLALTLDLEGCISVYANGPYVGVGQHGDRQFLLDAVRAWAGVTGRIKQRAGKDFYDWVATGAEAIALCRQIEPYLICKSEQARAVMRFPLGRQGIRLSEEIAAVRRELVEIAGRCNMTGPRPVPAGAVERSAAWCKAIDLFTEEQRMKLLALSIDWEGTITVRRQKTKDVVRGLYYEPTISLSQAVHRACLLEVMMKLTGGVGSICKVGHSEESLPFGWTLMKNWRASGPAAINLARALAPHLVAKREQAVALAGLIIEDRRGAALVPDEVHSKREAAWLRCHKLNAKESP